MSFSTRTIISPVLPLMEDEFGIGHAKAGGFFFFVSIGYTVTLLLSGLLSPRIGYKRSILLGFSILVIAVFGLSRAESYSSVAVVCIFIGLGAGIYLPSAIPLLTGSFGHKDWGKAIAFHDTAASFSILAIPLLAAFALRFVPWRLLFVILSVACLSVMIVFWLLAPDLHPKEERKSWFSGVFRRKDFWILAILWTLAGAANLGLYNIIPLFLVKEKGMGLEFANTIFGVSRIGGFFTAILAGFLVDRYGAKRVLQFLMATIGLLTLALALAKTFPFLVTTLILQATVTPGFFPVGLVAISKLTNPGERSIFTGASIAFGVVFGLGLTPVILGAVADVWSFQIGILVIGGLATLSVVLLRNIKQI